MKLEHDGSFRVEDVEAGTYDLLINVTEPPLDPNTVGIGDKSNWFGPPGRGCSGDARRPKRRPARPGRDPSNPPRSGPS